MVRAKMNDKFQPYQSPTYLCGCLIVALVRGGFRGIRRKLLHFSTSDVAVDRFGIGTKGAVSIRFVLFDQSFAFINVHLEAKKGIKENSLKRIDQLKTIMQKMNFPVMPGGRQEWVNIDAHHTIFLFGDMNFRLREVTWEIFQAAALGKLRYKLTEHDVTEGIPVNTPGGEDATVETPSPSPSSHRGSLQHSAMFARTRNAALHLFRLAPRHHTLFDRDELHAELRKPRALVPYQGCRWEEPDVRFAPTFKLKLGAVAAKASTPEIYTEKRIPAWTCNEYHISDHDPVFGIFLVHVHRADVTAINSQVVQWQAKRGLGGSEETIGYTNAWISFLAGRPEHTERQYQVLKANMKFRAISAARLKEARDKAKVQWALNYLRPALEAVVSNPDKLALRTMFRCRTAFLEERLYEKSGNDLAVLNASSDGTLAFLEDKVESTLEKAESTLEKAESTLEKAESTLEGNPERGADTFVHFAAHEEMFSPIGLSDQNPFNPGTFCSSKKMRRLSSRDSLASIRSLRSLSRLSDLKQDASIRSSQEADASRPLHPDWRGHHYLDLMGSALGSEVYSWMDSRDAAAYSLESRLGSPRRELPEDVSTTTSTHVRIAATISESSEKARPGRIESAKRMGPSSAGIADSFASFKGTMGRIAEGEDSDADSMFEDGI
eukprot:GEMP01006017.1.p1 GENE.GEMP01006017.1~~GEMP01006017.1.p1  ORF type:complete len:664 (+),score=149.18 GEMP01006017.1:1113-3104(+)